ncbi:SDR family NAD(P)-dependent oxidoreductase [Glaciibacter sp. 2TAF33]|uniref:SDR family NAD(P)-dependent oxidoreductase n=1 Tax=Glaciibacter sp. 2TAF33 TaxID=3233015 RepID=UPI003F8DB12A
MLDLSGKSVIITGSGRGLGRAYALAVASAGGSVVVNDLEEESTNATVREITDKGGLAFGVAGSVADYEFTESLIARCVDEFGKLDGLVNNAGIYHVATPEDETELRMRRLIEVNVLGSMFAATHAFRQMASQGFGTIVNVTSGAHIGIRGFTTYGVSKGAVASLTYNMALEGQRVGVTVTGLSPMADTGKGENGARGLDAVGVDNRPSPAPVARLVTYLLSDQARNLNGQVVRLDSTGLSLLSPPHFRTRIAPGSFDSVDDVRSAFHTVLNGEVHAVGMPS